MGELTILLIPPTGDTALLADEAGCGRVPMALPSALPGTWFAPSRIDGDISGLPGRALLLVRDDVPVAMGCDRALRVAIPVHKARRDAVRAKIEARARVIYAARPGADRHPWIEGGNSNAQYDARCDARREMSDDDLAQAGSLRVIMGPTYAVEDALWIARLYARNNPGARVVLLRDGREVSQ